ncbi:MAG: MFS transporter [Pseudomonadota bacterium]
MDVTPLTLLTRRFPSVYPGWFVMAACFTCAMLIIGSTLYVFQLFVLPVTEEFSISRADANLAYIALLIGMALWSPFVGRLLDRVSPHILMPAGAGVFFLTFALISISPSPVLMLAIIAAFLGLAVATAGGLAANAVTSRWFLKRRGRALGIVSVASSAGGFAMVPATAALIEAFGWRTALFCIGAGVGVIVALVSFFLIKARPDEDDMANFDEFSGIEASLANATPSEDAAADGAARSSTAASDGGLEAKSWSAGALIKERNFWLLALGAGLLLASDQAVLTSQYPFFIDAGFSASQAAAIISAMTFSAIGGKLIVGSLADHIDNRYLFGLVALFHALLLGVYLWQPGFLFLLVFASIFGAAVGGIYPVWSTLTASAFGAASFGGVFGAMAPIMQTLSIIFVRFIGQSYDNTGSYDFAFTAFLGAVVVAFGLIMLMKLPKN